MPRRLAAASFRLAAITALLATTAAAQIGEQIFVRDSQPDWSPDGTRVVFAARSPDGGSHNELFLNVIARRPSPFDVWTRYLIPRLGGSRGVRPGLLRLTDGFTYKKRPVWSPDGKRIAYMAGRRDNWDIYVIEATGGVGRRLTDNPGWDGDPAWSPDGRRILYSSDVNGRRQLYILDLAGGRRDRFLVSQANDDAPAWSRGGRIAFVSDRSGHSDIFVAGADGADLRRVTSDPGDDSAPRWSPDGKQLAFMSNRTGNWDIFVLPGMHRKPIQLTSDPAHDVYPTWLADGRRVMFGSDRESRYGMYLRAAPSENGYRLPASGYRPEGGFTPVSPSQTDLLNTEY